MRLGIKFIILLTILSLDFYRKKKNLYKNIRGSNRSFRLPSVRLRHESVRLRPICQFAYNSYVKALKLNC